MLNVLKDILSNSGLDELFLLKKDEDLQEYEYPHVNYRVKTNIYRIRSFELWGNKEDFYFRIYHASNIDVTLKEKLNAINGMINNTKDKIDFYVEDYVKLAIDIKNILSNEEVIKECKKNSPRARTSKFEGLDLPDIDTTQNDVLGQTFTWREIISIWEDNSEINELKKSLSRNGIYIQRSKDGKARYIGSAYGENGIIGRWMKHLDSNGDAQYLNLFVLENGYDEIIFSVIEFHDNVDDIIKIENKWKQILGTINYGPYNGIQLNNN